MHIDWPWELANLMSDIDQKTPLKNASMNMLLLQRMTLPDDLLCFASLPLMLSDIAQKGIPKILDEKVPDMADEMHGPVMCPVT